MPVVGSPPSEPVAWTTVQARLRARGLRWTPQRRTLIEVLSRTDGHVTGAELVDDRSAEARSFVDNRLGSESGGP